MPEPTHSANHPNEISAMATKFQRTDRPLWTLVASSFGLGMALLDVTAGIVAVPSIQASLHTDIRGLSWVIDGYTLSFASLLLLGGGLGDRLGAKQVFGAGLIAFTVASAACGLSPNVPALIGARIMQGVGAALFMPSSLAILGRRILSRGSARRRSASGAVSPRSLEPADPFWVGCWWPRSAGAVSFCLTFRSVCLAWRWRSASFPRHRRASPETWTTCQRN